MDWHDVQIFLVVSRCGSIRSAAPHLHISHSTISRRIDSFETQLGVKLFDRLPNGFALTTAGESLLKTAERIEAEMDTAERQLTGMDGRISGVIKLTMIEVMATHLIMPDLADFKNLYPDIEFEISVSYQALDLNRREADIALRFTEAPPEHLMGRQLAKLATAPYATRGYMDTHDLSDPNSASWLGYGSGRSFPSWVKNSDYPHLPAKGIYADKQVQLAAAKAGLGIAILPCFVGEREPQLFMLPNARPRFLHNLWLLRHPDTRFSARLRVFSEFLMERIRGYKPLLEYRGADT